jgi:hypothetical protein
MAMKPYRCRQGHIESWNRVTLKVALQLWYSTVASDDHETINIMMTEDAVAIPALLRSYPRNDTTASFP